VIALLCSLLTVLPASEQYAGKSLPAGMTRVLGPHVGPNDGIYRVQRFREQGRTLWIVSPPCGEESGSCRVVLFLESGHDLREVGKANGDLVDADPETGVPVELSFHVAAAKTETQLRWSDGRYVAKKVARWFRDPLTRERINAAELRARGMLDLQNGRFTVAAGRYALLCQDPCAVLEVETLATALLEARLFDQAEAALRRAIAMPGHQLQDLASLASLLHAEGREKDATVVDRKLAQEDPDAGP
jgi:hypothetical protein